MSHEARQVNAVHLSDGAIAVCFRCCEDKTTEQWHTLYLKPETTEQEIRDFIAYAKKLTEDMHSVRDHARDILDKGLK